MSEAPLTDDEIRAVRRVLSALSGGGASRGSSGASQGAPSGRAAGPAILDADWCQGMIVKKVPPSWKGRDFLGNRLSDECTAEELDALAEFFEWKAQKGREENPVRLNNKGEPWHKRDTFEAEIARGFAARARSRPAKAKGGGRAPEHDDAPDDNSIPF